VGLIQRVVPILPTHTLIRPRPGDFCYDGSERATMQADIDEAFEAGSAAVVVGALTPDGNIDEPALEGFLRAAGTRPVHFHRAFDMCRNPFEALEILCAAGVRGILTSGQRRSAAEGVELIAELVRRSGSQLRILPGAGVTPANAAAIIQRTGAGSIHFSAREATGSPMRFRNPAVSMGSSTRDEYLRSDTSEQSVRAIVEAVRQSPGAKWIDSTG